MDRISDLYRRSLKELAAEGKSLAEEHDLRPERVSKRMFGNQVRLFQILDGSFASPDVYDEAYAALEELKRELSGCASNAMADDEGAAA